MHVSTHVNLTMGFYRKKKIILLSRIPLTVKS